MFVGGLGGCVLTGLVAGIITHYFDLVLVFAALLGALAGLCVKFAARAGHCRHPQLVLFAGLLFGLGTYFVKEFTNYRMTRREVMATIVETLHEQEPEADPAAVEGFAPVVYDRYMTEKHGRSGFLGWLSSVLESGISINGNPGSNREGLNLGWYGSLILLILEFGVAAAVSMALAMTVNSEPYCEACGSWVDETWTKVITPEGLQQSLEVVVAAQEGSAARGGLTALPESAAVGVRGTLALQQCPACRAGFLTGQLVQPAEKEGQVQTSSLYENAVLTTEAVELLLAEPSGEGA